MHGGDHRRHVSNKMRFLAKRFGAKIFLCSLEGSDGDMEDLSKKNGGISGHLGGVDMSHHLGKKSETVT